MNDKTTTIEPPTTWRPAGWRIGDEPEEPLTPENVYEKYEKFKAEGYYTPRGRLSASVQESDTFADEARDVSHNVKLLRDAWNTHPVAWRLFAAIIGCEPVIDPYWNPGTRGLPALKRKLSGMSPIDDGMLTVHGARGIVMGGEWEGKSVSRQMREQLAKRLEALGDVPNDFPVNWRGEKLKRGKAPAATNGPHSCTGVWLPSVLEYGREDFAAAFTPDAGDGYMSIGMSAAIVVRLGRVYCEPAPGIPKSNPMGASAMLVFIPPTIPRETLPAVTQRIMAGEPVAVPVWERPRAGVQHAYCHAGGLRTGGDGIVDLGLVGAQ